MLAFQVIYPGDAQLSGTEKLNICYLSFPDSNSSTAVDTNYHFCIRRASNSLNAAQLKYSEQVLPTADIDPAHYYGFVHFRFALPRFANFLKLRACNYVAQRV